MTSPRLDVDGMTLDLKKTRFGTALNVGTDMDLDANSFVNADLNYINPCSRTSCWGAARL